MAKDKIDIKTKETARYSIIKLIAEAKELQKESKELQKESKEARAELKRLFFL